MSAKKTTKAAPRDSSPKFDGPRLNNQAIASLKACRDKERTWLSLDDCNLERIPDEVFKLKHLRFIDLNFNKIELIPSDLWERLPNLQKLSILGNPLKFLPDHDGLIIDTKTYRDLYGQLSPHNVEVYVLDDTTVEEAETFLAFCSLNTGLLNLTLGTRTLIIGEKRRIFPPKGILKIIELAESFQGLKYLAIRGFNLKFLPKTLRQLNTLTHLRLDGVGLTELPDWISEFPLEQLSLVSNDLTSLPTSFSNLTGLKIFSLAWNKHITNIPAPIFNLKNLESLMLQDCKISSVPIDILKLTKLKNLVIDENPVENPPLEVARKGLSAIQNYWRQRADAGVDYLCEAKLIILGEPGAGKTTLANKILNKNYALSESEKSTEGIDVLLYHFPANIRKGEEENPEMLERKFQVNIWDFGGQEIYHATHQFFLTRRSVYVLVCDNRKEDTDFSYWLNVVEMLSGSSPLLLVQNEKQDRARDINFNALRGQFSNLKESFQTNLNTNRGLDEIIQSIKKELQCLPHIGAGLPATWKRVREALEKDTRERITLHEYLAICQSHGFSNLKDKLQLSEYLHDLGICLHFQDDPVLKNIVILKPSWGTDAVYRVLDDPNVIASHGRFSAGELGRIWSESKYEGMQHELLKLMTKFQLCYSLKEEDSYIAPQLLSPEQPPYPWIQTGGIVVRYNYKFLPKGIITRFIVAMHHLIDNGIVWKTGVVLTRDQSRVEVIEDYGQRTIRIRATGPNRHGLFTLVDEQFDRLHNSFYRLQLEKLLPCQCEECVTKADPYGFPLESLVKMANKGKEIQCHESGSLINAEKLIKEIFPGMYKPTSSQSEAEKMIMQTKKSTDEANEVFISYAWTDESKSIADLLQKSLEEQGIQLLRDRDQINYKDSIKAFMQRLGKGKCVVLLISEKYLKSTNCMFELLEISKAQKLRERIFPVVLSDANIYDPLTLISYVKFWEDKIESLDTALKSLRGDNLINLQQELNLYSDIRHAFDNLSGTLRDMNALSPKAHQDNKFSQLISSINSQMKV